MNPSITTHSVLSRSPHPFRRRRLTLPFLAAVLSAVLQAGVAAAQPAPSPQDIALAETAFNEGIALVQAGNCKDAVVKLELSQKIDPAAGTALQLGKCYEALGRTASAYGAYSQSAGLARVKVDDYTAFRDFLGRVDQAFARKVVLKGPAAGKTAER